MSNKWEKAISIIIFLFIGLIIFRLIDWSFINGEITAYPVACTYKLKYIGDKCKKIKWLNSPEVYKPNADRQYVVDVNNQVTQKDCSVTDRKNWRCEYPDTHTSFGFVNGYYYENEDYLTASWIQNLGYPYTVSRFEWIFLNFKEAGINSLILFPAYLIRGVR